MSLKFAIIIHAMNAIKPFLLAVAAATALSAAAEDREIAEDIMGDSPRT